MRGRRDPREHQREQFCYLTTTGRRTGRPHEIEIWFAFPPDAASGTLYMMAGGGERADWIRNLQHTPAVAIRFGDETWPATARGIVPGTAEDTLARQLLCEKYQGWREGQPLSEWGRTALPVAFEFAAGAA
jgi:deazaflavin-dependent oxidoreductase (nitroreductase family)